MNKTYNPLMEAKNDNFFYISVLHWQASLLGPVSN
jgi:hypothetical protein